MKKMIWIPDNLVEGIKEAAYQERKSVSEYLVGLHLDKRMSQSVFKNVTEVLIKSEPIKDIIKPEIKKISYSDEYRKKNPMERCRVCQKALSMNCGH